MEKNTVKTFIILAFIFTFNYAVIIILGYFLFGSTDTLEFLFDSIVLVFILSMINAHYFITYYKRFFKIQKLFIESGMTDNELLQKTNLSIEKIALLKIKENSLSDKELESLEKIFKDN